MTFHSDSVPEWEKNEINLWIKSYPKSYNYLMSLFSDLKYNYDKRFLYRDNILKSLHSEINPYQFQELIKKLITSLETEQRNKIVQKTKDELSKDYVQRVIDQTIKGTKEDLTSIASFGTNYLLIGAGVLLALYVLKG